jgi:hypothetical protein
VEKVDVVLEESAKAFYDEWKRTDRLRGLGERLIAAVAVVVGFHLIEIDNLALVGVWEETIDSWLAVCGLLALSVSLVLTLLSMRIGAFHGRPRGMTLIDEVKDPDITDDVAKIMIAKTYLQATEINAGINDRRGRLLMFSGALLVTGFVLAVASYVIAKISF